MLQHTVIANGLTFTVVDDVALVYRVLAHGQVRDVVTGRMLNQPFFISLNRKDIAVKTMADGLFCISGDDQRVFPSHASQAYTVQATFSAHGYADQTITINVPAGVPYPIIVLPVMLRPQPIVLAGRVTDNTGAPVVGAVVSAQDSVAQHALILRSPLMNRFNTGATVTAVPPTGVTCTLTQTADAGEAVLVLNNTLAATRVNITDGVNTEQIDVGVLSGADGYYQARGIGGLSRLLLHCVSGLITRTANYVVNYGQAVNRVDFLL